MRFANWTKFHQCMCRLTSSDNSVSCFLNQISLSLRCFSNNWVALVICHFIIMNDTLKDTSTDVKITFICPLLSSFAILFLPQAGFPFLTAIPLLFEKILTSHPKESHTELIAINTDKQEVKKQPQKHHKRKFHKLR